MVPGERIELPTNGLQNRCSTAELTRQIAHSQVLRHLPRRTLEDTAINPQRHRRVMPAPRGNRMHRHAAIQQEGFCVPRRSWNRNPGKPGFAARAMNCSLTGRGWRGDARAPGCVENIRFRQGVQILPRGRNQVVGAKIKCGGVKAPGP